MTSFEKLNNSFVLKDDEKTMAFPLGSVMFHYSKKSDSIDLKLRGSRRTVYTVKYQDIWSPAPTDKDDALRKLNELAN